MVRDDGSETLPMESGEIVLRTPSMMQGYFQNPQATSNVLYDGWLLTGDVGIRDKDGYIWVLDRKKDMIISGGINVCPKEIEDLLLTSPEIADIAVIGVPHSDWWESVCAMVVAKPGTNPTLESVREFCQGKLADYKIPRIVNVTQILPRNSSGKLLKYVLRSQVSI